ncbi:peptide deformylase [Amylibacter sp.]|nr:peptide deformylase [Amylibacter sp.]MDB4248322.1 peptide deformylase [Amylibacter sp.]MDB9817198.1 peptide deformylase [Amylibacter sp.]
MSLLPILLHPDPRLKKLCVPVQSVDAETRKLADSMIETMYDAPGVGLAAPQVASDTRIFVMDCTDSESDNQPLVLINPEIISVSEELNTYSEGCLSLPDLFEDVERPKQVRMSFLDIDGKKHDELFDGLWATCAQHELDHLNGVLFIDHLSRMKRSMMTKKMVKLKKELALT